MKFNLTEAQKSIFEEKVDSYRRVLPTVANPIEYFKEQTGIWTATLSHEFVEALGSSKIAVLEAIRKS